MSKKNKKSKQDTQDVPEDELLLAQAIAACGAKKLCYGDGALFQKQLKDDMICLDTPKGATHVCALGALAAAGVFSAETATNIQAGLSRKWKHLQNVPSGNDAPDNPNWEGDLDEDNGESLGYAFQQFFVTDE